MIRRPPLGLQPDPSGARARCGIRSLLSLARCIGTRSAVAGSVTDRPRNAGWRNDRRSLEQPEVEVAPARINAKSQPARPLLRVGRQLDDTRHGEVAVAIDPSDLVSADPVGARDRAAMAPPCRRCSLQSASHRRADHSEPRRPQSRRCPCPGGTASLTSLTAPRVSNTSATTENTWKGRARASVSRADAHHRSTQRRDGRLRSPR